MADKKISVLFTDNPITSVPDAAMFEIAGDFGSGMASGAIAYSDLKALIISGLATSASVTTVSNAAAAAQSTANTAESTATSAATDAATAITTANSAQTDATAALADAAAAQTDATTALTNAATAQTTADSAVAGLLTADTGFAAIPGGESGDKSVVSSFPTDTQLQNPTTLFSGLSPIDGTAASFLAQLGSIVKAMLHASYSGKYPHI